MITNNDQARKLIEAHCITTDNVTRPQLKLLHSLIDSEMKNSGLYDGKYGMNRGVSKFMTCHSSHWEKREAVSFNRDGFIGFAGWADSQNTQPILDAVEKWLDAICAGERSMTEFKHQPGERFGPLQLKLIRRTSGPCRDHTHAFFECACGNEFKTRIDSVQQGRTKSCGCRKYNTNETDPRDRPIKLINIWHSGLNTRAPNNA